ncbi:16693_t:CDS:1, partial [Racocetra persica]
QNYPNKGTRTIYLNQQLEGILDCSEYKNLYKIYISTSVDRNKFEIIKGSCESWEKGKKYETKIIPCSLAQDYLDKNYPKMELV